MDARRHRAVLFKAVADLLPAACSVPCTLARRADTARNDVSEDGGYSCFITFRRAAALAGAQDPGTT